MAQQTWIKALSFAIRGMQYHLPTLYPACEFRPRLVFWSHVTRIAHSPTPESKVGRVEDQFELHLTTWPSHALLVSILILASDPNMFSAWISGSEYHYQLLRQQSKHIQALQIQEVHLGPHSNAGNFLLFLSIFSYLSYLGHPSLLGLQTKTRR